MRLLCQLVKVPASGYYAWQQAQHHEVAQAEPAWATALVKVFGVHKCCYSTRRLRIELRQGLPRGAATATHGHAPPGPACAATQSLYPAHHGLRCAPNRLLDQPKPTQANRVWVSDITYLPLANGDWAYLCAFQDMASKHVVGWQVGATMPEELVTRALQRAFWSQPPTLGIVVHSDRSG